MFTGFKCVAVLLMVIMMFFAVGAVVEKADAQQGGNNYAGYNSTTHRGSISTSQAALVGAGMNIVAGPDSFQACRNKLHALGAKTSTGAPW